MSAAIGIFTGAIMVFPRDGEGSYQTTLLAYGGSGSTGGQAFQTHENLIYALRAIGVPEAKLPPKEFECQLQVDILTTEDLLRRLGFLPKLNE